MARPAGDALLERYGWPKQALAIAGLGAVVAIVACGLAWWRQRAQAEDAFKAVGTGVERSVTQELKQKLELLQSLRALWLSSKSVERDEFQAFAGHLLAIGARNVVSFELDEPLTAKQREEFERKVKDELGRAVAVHDENGAPAPRAQDHFAVAYSRSQTGADGDVGLDVGLDRDTRSLLELASGKDAVVARIATDPKTRETLVVAALPVASRDPDATVGHDGLAVGKYSLDDLLDAALKHLPLDSVDVVIADANAPGVALADFGLEPGESRDLAQRQPHYSFSIPNAGLSLIATCAPTPEWSSEHRSSLPWVLLFGGLAVSALVATYVRDLERRSNSLSKANAELYTEVAVRHEVEKELLETQRKLETLVSNLPGLAYRCRNDSDWTMEFISDGSLPLTGFKPADFYSGRVSFGQRVIHVDDRERVWADVQRALDARRPFELEYRIVTAFGEERWVWEQGRGVYSRAGEMLALEGFVTDISERRRAEQQLTREKRFSDAIVAALPGNFYVFDEKGRFVRWNDNVERVTGYSAAELGQMKPLDFFAPEDQDAIARSVAEVFERGSTSIEAELLAKDGTRHPFFFTGVRFAWENTRFLVGVGIDVAERQRARDERERMQASLLPAQKLESLGVLAGAIAHDFNNRLTVVLGHTGLAQRMLPRSSEVQENLEHAVTAARSAAQLTRQLLDYADLEGRVRSEVDLSEEIGAFAPLLRSSIPRTISLEFQLAEHLPPVEADAAQVQQLVVNLVLNAAESYGDKGGSIGIVTASDFVGADAARSHATRGEARSGPCVRLSVSDRGAGLDEATLARIGEMFFTTKSRGRGLGLAAVLGILRAHGGWLRVETEPGRGSVFSVFFPLAKVPPSARPSS